MVDEVSPIFLDIFLSLSSGEKPPEGYNWARLFLIPKNSSLLAADTRPISVTNSDNRIIAKMLNNLIIAPLSKIIDQEQRGFIPGRSILENVERVTSAYYASLKKKEQYYLLLLDTRRPLTL